MPLSRNRQVSRHPSNVETRGFLGLNRRWIPRPASWAGPSAVVTGRTSSGVSSVSAFVFGGCKSGSMWYAVLSAKYA